MVTHIGTETIETDRLILRRFAYSDCDSMLKNWIADENVQPLYGEPVYSTKEEVNGLLDKYISSYEKNDYYRWAVILKETGECIGQIAFYIVDSRNHSAEIEYCIGCDFQCKGFASEATKAVIKFGFEKVGLHKIDICARDKNTPSRRVIEKCGFVYEGTSRDHFFFDGEYQGKMFFSILRSEYENKIY